MRRKVVQQGPSTLMVSLPMKWVKENGILKGDELNLRVVDNELTISPEYHEEKKSTKLHLKKNDTYFDRMLMTKYREGYNEVQITYEDPSIAHNIRETIKYLLGFEIVDQTANSCTIKNLSGESQEEYDTVLRRMFQIVVTIADECMTYVNTKDTKHLDAAVDLRETLTKLEQFALRLVTTKHDLSVTKKSIAYYQIWNIASFGKQWSSLAKKPLSKNPTLSKKDVEFMKSTVAYARSFYTAFYSRKYEDLTHLKEQQYALRPLGSKLLDESKNRMVIYYLLRQFNRMYEFSLTLDPEGK